MTQRLEWDEDEIRPSFPNLCPPQIFGRKLHCCKQHNKQNKGVSMKKQIAIVALTAFAGSLLAAENGAKEEVTSAAKKLGEKSNYSWKTTVVVPESAQFKPGPTEGKTEKDGFTHVK